MATITKPKFEFKCQTKVLSIYSLMKRMKSGNIKWNENYFQRNLGLWGNGNPNTNSLLARTAGSEFIESLMGGMTTPAIYLTKIGTEGSIVFDGQQRLYELFTFLEPQAAGLSTPLKIRGLKGRTDLNEKTFDDFDDDDKMKLIDCNMHIIEIEEENEERRQDIFRRLNMGKPLSYSEKKQATIPKDNVKLLRSIALSKYYSNISNANRRRGEIENHMARITALMEAEKDGETRGWRIGYTANKSAEIGFEIWQNTPLIDLQEIKINILFAFYLIDEIGSSIIKKDQVPKTIIAEIFIPLTAALASLNDKDKKKIKENASMIKFMFEKKKEELRKLALRTSGACSTDNRREISDIIESILSKTLER